MSDALALVPASVDPTAFFTRSQIDLIKRQVAKGVSDDELQLFLYQCARTGLDPLSRQIYALERREKVGDQWVNKMSIQTGIDGLRLIAERTARYAPGPETTYEYDSGANLRRATAYVKKLTADGTWHTVSASAFWSEYVATTRDGAPTRIWKEKPHVMLGKCAESLALRRAFPAEMSGLYTGEEMDKANSGVDYEPPKAERKAPKPAPAPAVGEADERALRINKLCKMKSPEGLGWTTAGARGWLKKRFKVDATNKLTDQQKRDAELLLIARLSSEAEYTAKVAELAATGRCVGDPPDGAVDEDQDADL
ncbi:MAG TPA: phage recombination protein Bet [Actinomycetota bacterium]|nr:phage recombination protein Bet [Actinomycetota bacterium]